MTDAPDAIQNRARLEAVLLARRAQRPAGIATLPRHEGSNAFPVSPVQQLMWQLHNECPGESTWVTLGGVRLYGPLDLAVLKRAFDAMTERHESLRTTFRLAADGGLEQVIRPRSERLEMPVLDVSAETVRQAAAAIFDEPFDLTRGPLTRFNVLRVSPDEHHLMLVQHHSVSDGVSAEIFIADLAAFYLACVAGQDDCPLPALAAQPADLAAWQRDLFDQAAKTRLVSYWTDRLAGASPLQLPTNMRRGPKPSSAGLTCQLAVEQETMDALRQLGQEHNATLFMVTLAAFHVLFAWYTGQRDAMVATPYSYRDRPEYYAPVGAFINYLMLRADLSDDPDFREVVNRVREDTLSDFEHNALPFNDLIEALGLDPPAGRHSLMRALFTEESDPDIPLPDNVGLRSEMILDPPWNHALRDFTLRVTAGEGGTHVVVTYRSDAFSPHRAADIAADYRDLLRLAARDPGFRVFGQSGRPPLRLRRMAPSVPPSAEPRDLPQEEL